MLLDEYILLAVEQQFNTEKDNDLQNRLEKHMKVAGKNGKHIQTLFTALLALSNIWLVCVIGSDAAPDWPTHE